jgi:hypothetical protein
VTNSRQHGPHPATVVGAGYHRTYDVGTGPHGDDMDVEETKAVLRARHNPDASNSKNDQCIWRFRARSEEERQHWMKAIRRSVYLVARVETTPTLCGVGSVHGKSAWCSDVTVGYLRTYQTYFIRNALYVHIHSIYIYSNVIN